MKNKSPIEKDYPRGAFVPFYHFFPDLSEQETRKVTLLQETFGLPAGLYLLFESYCSDKDCDCRKVMINVLFQSDSQYILGTVGFGWESEKFYTKWMGEKLPDCRMSGAYLETEGIHTDYSKKCLELVKNSLSDPHYVNLIKKHYKSFKELLKN